MPELDILSFEETFSSETALQQDIARLLQRMPNVTGVQILQGPLERGKDVLFYAPGPLGDRIPCACVVKNGRITGNIERQSGARTVFFQAEQALTIPYTDATGAEIHIRQVFVMSPAPIDSAAIASISGQLRERGGQVTFKCGADLFQLFREHWPTYLSDKASEEDPIETHLTGTKDHLENDQTLLWLALQYQLGPVERGARLHYVPQRLERALCSWDLGPVLTKDLPTARRIMEPFNYPRYQELVQGIRRVDEALRYLGDYGYFDYDQIYGDGLPKLITLIQDAWQESLRLTYRTRNVANLRPGDEVAVELADRNGLPNSLRVILQAHSSVTDKLRTLLAAHNTRLKTSTWRNHEELKSNRFAEACALDDCARDAPEGTFEKTGTQRVSISRVLIDDEGCSFLITGSPGYGKTSFCKFHALDDVEAYRTQSSGIIPVHVPLHLAAYSDATTFEDLLQKHIKSNALLGELSSNESGFKQFRVYLDGLDEVTTDQRKRGLMTLAQTALSERSDTQILVTARDHVRGPYLSWIPRINLCGFDEPEIRTFVLNWLSGSQSQSREFFDQLATIPSLHKLMSTPLLATLVMMVFRSTGRLPESKVRLYQIFIDLLCGGWDAAKNRIRTSDFSQRVKAQVLTTLAGRIHERRKRTFSRGDFKESTRAMSFGNSDVGPGKLLREMVEDGVVVKGGRVLQFAHLSFQEFLAAQDLAGQPGSSRLTTALRRYYEGDDWWAEVLRFYVGIANRPAETDSWFQDEFFRLGHVPEQRLLSLRDTIAEYFPEYSHSALRRRQGRRLS